MIENDEAGIFWPCNRERSDTSGLVKYIAECRGRKIFLIPGLAGILKLISKVSGYVNKAFGSLVYEQGLGDYKVDYRLYSLNDSIRETIL